MSVQPPFELARDALTDAAVKEGWWTEWDQQMRDKITAALKAMYANELQATAPKGT